jgi:hypothetical protein
VAGEAIRRIPQKSPFQNNADGLLDGLSPASTPPYRAHRRFFSVDWRRREDRATGIEVDGTYLRRGQWLLVLQLGLPSP